MIGKPFGKLYMLQISFYLRFGSFKNMIRRQIYCKRGYHRFASHTWSRTNAKGKSLGVSYIKCPICGTCFFRNKEDKKIYERLVHGDDMKAREFIRKLSKMKINPRKGKLKIKEF